MVMKVWRQVHTKVKFLYRQDKYLTPRLKRWLQFYPILIVLSHLGFTYPIKFKTKGSGSTKQILILLLRSTLHSHIIAILLWKMNRLPVAAKVESCIPTTVFLNSRMLLYHLILISLSLHTKGIILDHKLHWIYSYEKQIQDVSGHLEQALSFLRLETWAKLSYSSKNVKTTVSFTYTLKRDILSKLCKPIILNSKHIFQ